MTILIVCNTLEYLISHRWRVYEILIEQGHDVRVVVGPSASTQMRNIDTTEKLDILKGNGALFVNARNSLISNLKFMFFCWTSLDWRPNKVVLIGSKCFLLALPSLLLKAPQTPTILSVSGMGFIQPRPAKRDTLRRKFFRTIYFWSMIIHSHTKKLNIIVQNQSDKALISKRVPHVCVDLVPGVGINLSRFSTSKVREYEKIVLFLGRPIMDKGIHEFVQMGITLFREFPAWRFCVAGALDYQTLSPAFSPSESSGVEFIGHISNPVELLQRASILCLPSHREGMSKVLMEGAAAGCALVTCDVPGCRELVINGETGFVTPPYDVSALTNAVRDLIRAPKLVKRMGTFGRELAFKKFDESVMARAIANIITN